LINSDIKTVALLTLGCSKNVVDSEYLISHLEDSGFEVSTNPQNCDALIINTCGFINDAKQESINVIFQGSELKRRRKIKQLIVMGCLSERYADSLKNQIPHIDNVIGVNTPEKVVESLGGIFQNVYKRRLLTLPHYAYLKIAEGCNHRCSFCAIPMIRGNYRSRRMKDILREAEGLAKDGVKEINIIAQDTTYYGKDLYYEQRLPSLVNRLAQENYFKWIRVLYTYPTAFPIRLTEVMAKHDNVCKYLDLPLQHISDNILKSMGRGAIKKRITSLLDEIRSIVPNIAIRTTFIVGYPNETEDEFIDLLHFVEDQRFARLGVFAYSPEEGTPAFSLGDPISIEVKNQRIDRIMLCQQKISLSANRSLINSNIDVIVDSKNANTYLGRTQADAPEIDNGVVIRTKKKLNPGMIITAKVIQAKEYDIITTF